LLSPICVLFLLIYYLAKFSTPFLSLSLTAFLKFHKVNIMHR
jgi:hypothetical protein